MIPALVAVVVVGLAVLAWLLLRDVPADTSTDDEGIPW